MHYSWYLISFLNILAFSFIYSNSYYLANLGQRLAITLGFLATGANLNTFAYGFHVGNSTAYHIVNETCTAIHRLLSPDYLKPPDTRQCEAANCVGAIDGRQFSIQCPPNSGSQYYNYKQFRSQMLAVCDANYIFTVADVGAAGREGDRAVFSSSKMAEAMENGTLGIPPCSSSLFKQNNTSFPRW